MMGLFHIGKHRPWWSCPDVRGLNVPYANEQLGAVLGEGVGGGFSGSIGSGFGRSGGGTQPAIEKIQVPPGAWGYPPSVWLNPAADYSTPVADLDFYPRRDTNIVGGNYNHGDNQGSPVAFQVDYLGGVSGGLADAMGFGALGPRRNPTAEQTTNRNFGGLLGDAGSAGI